MENKKQKVKKIEVKMKFNLRKFLTWMLFLFLFLPGIISFLGGGEGLLEEMSLSDGLEDIKNGEVEKVEIRGDDLMFYYEGEEDLENIRTTRKEEGSSFIEILQGAEIENGAVNVEVKSQDLSKAIWNVLSLVLPILLFGGLMYFITKRQMGAGQNMFGFGKSKAKLFVKGKQLVDFKKVAGVEEAKKELEEVVDFLKRPKKYKALGARTPKGVLLIGPSGVGKTLLAKAVAGEAGVPFLSMAGSEFMEMLVGVGASRVRDLFDTAKKMSPSIIFIDEIDAIGRTRGGGAIGGHDEREQTLNQILVEMDGFNPNDNVIVIAATNRPDVLDTALVRPGRFDRRVSLDLPDIADRKEIVAIHAQGKPFDSKVDWDKVSEMTAGFSGADLENMLNEAAILTARKDKKKIVMEDIREAATKVKLGPERKRLQNKEERKMTAYHEAGHAVVSYLLPTTDPVQEVSIVSRGMALGYTMSRPTSDKYQQTKTELEEQIVMMLGGRAAEKIVFNELTAGAASDIERATRLARSMVVNLGMSRLGPVALGPMWEKDLRGMMYNQPVQISDDMKTKIDTEIKYLVDNAYKKAEVLLKKNKKKMDDLVKRLIKVETVESVEFEKIMGIKKDEKKASLN